MIPVYLLTWLLACSLVAIGFWLEHRSKRRHEQAMRALDDVLSSLDWLTAPTEAHARALRRADECGAEARRLALMAFCFEAASVVVTFVALVQMLLNLT